jgi:hypothetical protein
VQKRLNSDKRSGNVNNHWVGGLPGSYADRAVFLLEAGFTPSQLPVLGEFVERVARQHFEKAIASFRIPLPKSTMVMGIADPTGTLKPGEIHLAFSHSIIDEESGECFPFLDNQDVLVARHPSLRNSDIQKVSAHYIHKLAYLLDVVVFPSKGCVPLASKLQGGDYDGDMFWVCWEPRLTRDFKNAPEPLPDKQPAPEHLGISVDRRKLNEFLSGPDAVKTFLTESFRFRFQPDMLGKCTNLYKRLSYDENSLSSPGVVALANLHDYLIDADKNGYIYGEAAYKQYVQACTGRRNVFLKARGYEEAMSIGFERLMKPPRPLVHILDILFFGLMEPKINTVLGKLHEICTPIDDYDESLTEPYQSELTIGDAQIQEELAALKGKLELIYRSYLSMRKPPSNDFGDNRSNQAMDNGTKMDMDNWQMAIDHCFKDYTRLMPSSTDHPSIKSWMRRIGQGPSWWDSLKASAMYATFMSRKTLTKIRFLWLMAGEHLAYMKALHGIATRHVTGVMHANMKPNRVRRLLEEEIEGSAGDISFCNTENALSQIIQDDEGALSVVSEYESATESSEYESFY